MEKTMNTPTPLTPPRALRAFLLLGLAALLAPAMPAAHSPLLPTPQQIKYGDGRLALKDVSLSFASAPLAEDLFAADHLAAALGELTGATVPIATGRATAGSIVFTRTGEVSPLPGADDQAGPASRESYELRITPTGGEVRARSSAGLYYAALTLRQLVEESAGENFLPVVEIRDWPAMAYRGFMMDVSHGALPTEAEIKRQIDALSRWKANQYYFYNEANIALRGYPLLNPGAVYTAAQIRRIVDYARERHVDVVPCLELYAHLHDVFRVERYADLAALPHGGEINPARPRVQAMMKDWVEQFAAMFPSPWFHIGLDEPWELEKAGSQAAGGVEPSKLYIDQLKLTVELVRQHGKRPMFWADVLGGARLFARYPELVSQLPKDVIAVPWHYNVKPDYVAFVEPFAKEKVPMVIAPGTWCWDEIVPDFQRTFENIDGFLADGRKFGAMGLINTGWSDGSQVLYRTALAGMAYGAAASWQTEPMNRAQFFSDYAAVSYAAPVAAKVAPALRALATAQQLASKALGSETIFRLWDDPLTAARLQRLAPQGESLRAIRLLAGEAQEQLMGALELASKPEADSLRSLLVVARMMDYAGMKYIFAQEIAGYFKTMGRKPSRADVQFYVGWQSGARNHGRVMDLMDEIGDLRGEYERAWREEYTERRLRSVLGRWEAEFEYWRRFQTRLWETLRNFKDGDTLPELEELRPRL
jgi:hypothetical protein